MGLFVVVAYFPPNPWEELICSNFLLGHLRKYKKVCGALSVDNTFLENYKEDPKKHPKWKLRIEHKKQPQRLIVTLNGTLRKYVERVDFKDKKELAKIVARFVKEYNNSRHYALGTRTPMEVTATSPVHSRIRMRRNPLEEVTCSHGIAAVSASATTSHTAVGTVRPTRWVPGGGSNPEEKKCEVGVF